MGGEKLGAGKVATEWDEVATMAMRNEDDLVDSGAETIDSGTKEEALIKGVRSRVFEKVDQDEIDKLQSVFIEKISEEDLENLYNGLENDLDTGIQDAVDYFGDVLDLDYELELDIYRIDGRTAGSVARDYLKEGCMRMQIDPYVWDGDVSGILRTIAHESWHLWQYSVMDAVMEMESPELVDRALLYQYNYRNYVTANTDYAGYQKQLVETEAVSFEELGGKMKVFEEKEWQKVQSEYPNLFDADKTRTVDRNFHGVMSKWDTGALLDKIGVRNLAELEEKGYDQFDVQTAQAVMDELGEKLGLELQMKVAMMDDLNGDKLFTTGVAEDVLPLSREKLTKLNIYDNIYYLAEVAWWKRQKQVQEDLSDEGKIYRTWARYKDKVGDKGNLFRFEQDRFAAGLRAILKEQKQMEDVERLPLMKRIWEKMKIRRSDETPYAWNDWSGVKYDAKERI